jgi:hypothetical protein
MERDIDLKFEEIYLSRKNSSESDKEDKMNKKLLDNTEQIDDSILFQCFSCCCFFLYL